MELQTEAVSQCQAWPPWINSELLVGKLCSATRSRLWLNWAPLNELSCNCLINATCPSAPSVAPWQCVNQSWEASWLAHVNGVSMVSFKKGLLALMWLNSTFCCCSSITRGYKLFPNFSYWTHCLKMFGYMLPPFFLLLLNQMKIHSSSMNVLKVLSNRLGKEIPITTSSL